ncbi:MAG TPA: diguanylate cyclase [Candidatus Limnocylindrales bacterium]|nr:diguanylate cyclase [Candidatus Limnocylindrales bacterium]
MPRRLPGPGRAPKPRPILLLIVYGVFLVIVGVTATAQVVLASTHFSTAVLNHTVGTDAQVVRGFVNEQLSPADLGGELDPERRLGLEQSLRSFITRRGILHAEVRGPDGAIILSDVPVTGWAGSESPDWHLALDGQVAVAIVEPRTSESAVADLGTSSLLREYFPLLRDGRTVAVVGIWRDAEPITASLGSVRRDVVLVTMTAAVAAAIVLFLVFRSAQGRISRQTVALLDSTRRDALTGLLNHGALIEGLAETTERLRGDGGGLTIALLDIDNFRNLNDTWGHGAGDSAILAVRDLLVRDVGEDVLVGRYGPDEFLVVAEGLATGEVGTRLERLRAALADVDLRFEGSERLPVTLSVAVSAYPDHGESVTELLAATAVTLREAKSSGGDAILYTGASAQETAETRTFDVFQGLILAVDAKDRYTKRHSEDVARYALFLAARVGLPADELPTVRMAGLLHDVGKIGIPDQILRKPGKLSEAEFAVVQQHVALGDAIVRDLPNLDAIRAGIRHHHERWDGSGYLHRLAGEEIPLVARILAVCDTFSAMTTSRPYRKALDLREALLRLEDAAGTQLDERLVAAFVEGIEQDANAPLPGDDGVASLWLPDQHRTARVA